MSTRLLPLQSARAPSSRGS